MPYLTSYLTSAVSHPLLSLPGAFPTFFRMGNDGKLEVTDQIIVVPARIAGLIIGFLLLRWVLHKVIRRFARRTGNGAVAGVLSKSKIGQGFVENTLANERRTQRAETIASLLCSTVTIVLQTDAMTLTAQGRASEDGAKGDTIRVVNLRSKKTIEAVVSGADQVTIHPGLHIPVN